MKKLTKDDNRNLLYTVILTCTCASMFLNSATLASAAAFLALFLTIILVIYY